MRHAVVVLLTIGTLLAAAAAVSAAGSTPICAPSPSPSSSSYWTPFGDAVWTANGLVTTSRADPTQPYGVTCGGASVTGGSLPTTNPKQITALSFDFNPDRSGPSGISPRLVVCFSDGPSCNSNGNLAPTQWTANTWTHVDGFAPSNGVDNVWGNQGGSCGTTYNTTWSAIIACHPGATITEIAVVNDSGSVYTAGEQVVLNNLTVNNVVAHAAPPVLGQLATVVPVMGQVMVKPHGARRFHAVKTITRIPYGAIVNASKGHLQIIAARGRGTESGVFYDGSFSLTQTKTGVVQAALTGRPACADASEASEASDASEAPEAHDAATKTFRLWGHVSGRFRTRGHYGSASVQGTIWLTEERCDGTFFHVVKGTLRIRDFTLHKTIILRAGHSYLAPSQPPDTYDHDGDYYSDKALGLIHDTDR